MKKTVRSYGVLIRKDLEFSTISFRLFMSIDEFLITFLSYSFDIESN